VHHPVFDEILRAKLPIRPEVFARWQKAIQNEVLPALAASAPKKAKETAA